MVPGISGARKDGYHPYTPIPNADNSNDAAMEHTLPMNPVRVTTYATGVLEHANSSKKPSSLQLRPMEYLTRSTRRSRYWWISGIIVLLLIIIVGGMFFEWYLHATTLSDNTPFQNDRAYEKRQHVADTALAQLNHPDAFHSTARLPNHLPCESTLLVIRHCDKLEIYHESTDDENVSTVPSSVEDHAADTRPGAKKKHGDRHCSAVGYERASYLTTLFGSSPEFRFPVPKFLYALSAQREKYFNYREWETLYPLSQTIHVNITVVDANAFAEELFFPLLQSGSLCGQIAIISWKHSLIPDLVNQLACGPNNGCPMFYPTDSFDQIWQLKYQWQETPNDFPLRNDTMLVDESAATSQDHTIYVDPSEPTFHLRSNHHHHHHKKQKKYHAPRDDDTTSGHWVVQGTVTNELFDPLAYSKTEGKYPFRNDP